MPKGIREEQEETFEVVFNTVHKTAKKLRLALEDQQDHAQTLLLKWWQQNLDLTAVDNLPAYTKRALDRLAIDLERKEQRRRTVTLRPEYNGEESHNAEVQQALQRYLETLQQDEENALRDAMWSEFEQMKFRNQKIMEAARLRYKEGLSIDEIAKLLGRSDETIRAYVGRVCDHLRRTLKVALESSG